MGMFVDMSVLVWIADSSTETASRTLQEVRARFSFSSYIRASDEVCFAPRIGIECAQLTNGWSTLLYNETRNSKAPALLVARCGFTCRARCLCAGSSAILARMFKRPRNTTLRYPHISPRRSSNTLTRTRTTARTLRPRYTSFLHTRGTLADALDAMPTACCSRAPRARRWLRLRASRARAKRASSFIKSVGLEASLRLGRLPQPRTFPAGSQAGPVAEDGTSTHRKYADTDYNQMLLSDDEQ
jgi:hypothetical protein